MRSSVLVATNTISQLVGRVFSTGATFLVTLLLASTLGTQGYGDFTKIVTFVSLFYLFADFGLNAMFLRDESEGKVTWSAFLGTRILVACVVMFFSIALVSFLPASKTEGYPLFIKFGIILYSPTILFQSLILAANALFQKNLRYDLSAMAVGLGSMVMLGIVGVSVYVFQPTVGVLASVVGLSLGTLCISILSLFFVRKFSPLRPSFDLSSVRRLLVQSLPLGLTLVLNVVYFRADSFILTLTRPTAEVGIYGFAYKFFEFILAFPTFLMNALYPLLLNSYASDKKTFIRLSLRAGGILFFVSLVAVVATWVAAPLVGLVRQGFELSILPLRLLALGLPFFFVSNLCMWILVVLKKQTTLLVVYGITMTMNTILNMLFVPRYGYVASAIITGISEAVVLALLGLILFSLYKSNNSHKEVS